MLVAYALLYLASAALSSPMRTSTRVMQRCVTPRHLSQGARSAKVAAQALGMRRRAMGAGIASILVLGMGTSEKARAERTDIPDCLKTCVKECTSIAPKSGDYCKEQCTSFCAQDPPEGAGTTPISSSGEPDSIPEDNYFSKIDRSKSGSAVKSLFDIYGTVFGR
ncbi:hypothetical protein AAMO2058_000934300 [Amorphochlora amoebiformis]